MSARAGAAQASHSDVRERVDLSWQDDAHCTQVDPEQFFPSQGTRTTVAAKKVCSGCPVITQCLEYSLAANEHYGVWGGLSEMDRRKLKRSRRAGAA